MAEYQELVQALTWLLTNRIQQKMDYTHGLLGDGNGRVRVSTTPGSPEVDYVYVRPDRFSNRAFKVFNKRVEGQDGDPVIIGELPWEPDLIQVIDLDWAAYADIGWGDDVTTTNRHGATHQWRDGAPGLDTFNVYRRQFGDLKTYPAISGTLAVGVSPYSLDIYGTQYQWPGIQAFSLSGAVPAGTGTARMALVYWSPASGTSGFLGVASGTVGSSADATFLNRPVTPQGAIPSAFVRLRGGQTSVTEFDIWDAREPFRPGLSFGTGSSQLSASMIPISDVVGFYTGSTVEAALNELPYKLISPDAGINPVLSADTAGDLTHAGTGTFSGWNIAAGDHMRADKFAFVVKNTSGAAASANDVGYIDEAGEYKTTMTAQADVSWCVVIVGGANNADIYVTRRGRVTVAYTGSAPSTGDFLVTSTTAGDAQAQTVMRPEIFAVCLAAGSGGAVSALLLTQRKTRPLASANNVVFVSAGTSSDFQAVVAAAGVSGDKVYHDPPSSGTVDAITPQATGELGKFVLHNTTQGEEAFIIATGTDATDDFIQVSASADISGWVTSDAIEVRSQTNTSLYTTGAYFFDVDLSTTTEIPVLSTVLWTTVRFWDTGNTNKPLATHPFEANANAKRQQALNPGTTGATTEDTLQLIPLIQQRFVVGWQSSGSATLSLVFRIRGVTVAAP